MKIFIYPFNSQINSHLILLFIYLFFQWTHLFIYLYIYFLNFCIINLIFEELMGALAQQEKMFDDEVQAPDISPHNFSQRTWYALKTLTAAKRRSKKSQQSNKINNHGFLKQSCLVNGHTGMNMSLVPMQKKQQLYLHINQIFRFILWRSCLCTYSPVFWSHSFVSSGSWAFCAHGF